MKRRQTHYPTDLTDKEWSLISELFSVSYVRGGRPPRHDKREILNAIFYLTRTGCQWRYLPFDFPPWKTVYTYFRLWKQAHLFEQINELRVRLSRVKRSRTCLPSAVIVDSQSVKTVEKGG